MRKLLWALVLVAGCGTVAGNPKKPKDPASPAPPPANVDVVYQLPEIDFSLSDESLSPGTDALNLKQLIPINAGGAADKATFNAWGRRFNQVVRKANAASSEVNRFIDRVPADADGVVRFTGKGKDDRLSGQIGPDVTGPYAYAAVLCLDAKPVRVFRWSEAGDAIELTQNFAAEFLDGEAAVNLVSRVRVEKAGDVTRIDVASTGEWSDTDEDGTDGGGIVERSRGERLPSGEIRLRTVADRFAGPAPVGAFEGDTYLVGKLVPKKAGVPAADASFVGYSKASVRPLCSAPFDEEAPTLWDPQLVGPKFCLGYQSGAGKFQSFEAFKAFVPKFQEIGLVKKAELEAVTLPEGLSCP